VSKHLGSISSCPPFPSSRQNTCDSDSSSEELLVAADAAALRRVLLRVLLRPPPRFAAPPPSWLPERGRFRPLPRAWDRPPRAPPRPLPRPRFGGDAGAAAAFLPLQRPTLVISRARVARENPKTVVANTFSVDVPALRPRPARPLPSLERASSSSQLAQLSLSLPAASSS